MPGMPKELRNAQIEDSEVARVEAIIRSMTPTERREPEVINGSRRLRIAQGSGTDTKDVNQLLKQFKEMQKMMQPLMAAAGGRPGKGKKKGRGGGRVTPRGAIAGVRELKKMQAMGDLEGLAGTPGGPEGGIDPELLRRLGRPGGPGLPGGRGR
jgi:signal recognition particle subunit SRP54